MTATSRLIILHNHLFKNAGTSVDRILRQNFPVQWHTREFPTDRGGNTAGVSRWIEALPTGIAFSSHTMLGPLPRPEGVTVLPVVLLRDPVDRIASAYRFERRQDAQTYGAILAKQHGFAGYVHARLTLKGDRQCRNFQTSRLASMRPDVGGSERDRAFAAVRMILREGVLGLVQDFDAAMGRLAARVVPHHPGFTWQPVTENASGGGAAQVVTPEMRAVIEAHNSDDLALVDYAASLLGQAETPARTPQAAGMA